MAQGEAQGRAWNAANPATARSWAETQDAARSLGLTLQSQEVRGPTDFERVFAVMAREHPRAFLLITDGVTLQHAQPIVDFVTRNRIPSMFDHPELVVTGALIGYGPSILALWRRAALYVDKILKGAKPADLPIEQPTKFELVINLKTAKALGLTIPRSLLLRADEVIQ
jgi:putative ABC transport system substrate-binding protein